MARPRVTVAPYYSDNREITAEGHSLPDPGACSAVPAVDAATMRQGQVEELVMLLCACLAWDEASSDRGAADAALTGAIARARRELAIPIRDVFRDLAVVFAPAPGDR